MPYPFFNPSFLDNSVPGFIGRIEACWDAETSNDTGGWHAGIRGHGQCAVTALIVQDHFGGELMRGEFAGGSHYWNRLADGTEIDLTASQFDVVPDFAHIAVRSRNYVLSYPATLRRYELLKARVEAVLAQAELALA